MKLESPQSKSAKSCRHRTRGSRSQTEPQFSARVAASHFIAYRGRVYGGFFVSFQIMPLGTDEEKCHRSPSSRFCYTSALISREVKMKRIALVLLLLRSICVLSQVTPESFNP